MILLLTGFLLGVVTTIAIIYTKDFIGEFMFMRYSKEHPTPEEVIEIGEAIMNHQHHHNENEFIDNGETENSYQ